MSDIEIQVVDWHNAYGKGFILGAAAIENNDVGYFQDWLARFPPEVRIIVVRFAELVIEANKREVTDD